MIYYSHVNEDSEVERRMLARQPFPTLVCIAGSGERLIALLDEAALGSVIVVDQHVEALHLTEMKLVALEMLEVEDYLTFAGFLPGSEDQRLGRYSHLQHHLSPACRAYWQRHPHLIARGLCRSGHFERFLDRIRPPVNAFLGKSFQRAFQQDLTAFPGLRWQLVKTIFSLKWIYQLFGNRDTAFVGKGSQIELIPQGIQRLLDEDQLGASFMAHLIFKGDLRSMSPEELPASVKPEVLAAVQERLREGSLHLTWKHGDLLSVLRSMDTRDHRGGIFASLSDILSFIDEAYLLDCLAELHRITAGKFTASVRAFLKRRESLAAFEVAQGEHYLIQERSVEESTCMYTVFEISQA